MSQPAERMITDVWTRELEVLVPLWQGADDRRVREGAAALGVLTTPAARRLAVEVPAGGSAREAGVRHRAAVAEVHRAQVEILGQHRPRRLLTLGGDCMVEVAAVAHLAGEYGTRLFVLWVDAHADLNTPAGSLSGTAHGMPLRLLLDPGATTDGVLPAPGCISPGQVALVGARDLDPAEGEYVRRHALTTVGVAALAADPARLAELPPSGAAVYVHLDLDVLDPATLPAVAVPTPGGLEPAVLAQALTAVRSRHDVVGVGITEYVPQLEHDPAVLVEVLDALGLVDA